MILIFETAMLGVIMVLFGLKRLTTDNVILTFFAVIKRKPIRNRNRHNLKKDGISRVACNLSFLNIPFILEKFSL